MSAHIAKPDLAQLMAYLMSNEWTEREAKKFIDRNWRLLGAATYDDREDLSVAYVEVQG